MCSAHAGCVVDDLGLHSLRLFAVEVHRLLLKSAEVWELSAIESNSHIFYLSSRAVESLQNCLSQHAECHLLVDHHEKRDWTTKVDQAKSLTVSSLGSSLEMLILGSAWPGALSQSLRSRRSFYL